jgi:saccharopine dehydrogenase-like NADP-dependent oxidoreductase
MCSDALCAPWMRICKKAGLIVLNEMGLDPGIDHMSAMRVLHKHPGRRWQNGSF